ncbi:hypothetical protein M0802_003560 [Mischocyttarus mexicanus]|nr:hypothetical protein M0802_003560 [Mischocyttarus mexicanus]
MNEETILKNIIPLNDNVDNEFVTQALLPGLFRATIVKLNNNNNNKYHDNDNYNDRLRKRKVEINSERDTTKISKPNFDCEDIQLRSSNHSIGDLLLIATDSHKTLSTYQTHPRVCPAYPFCVERNTTAKMVTIDQEDSIVNNELSTLRDLLKPIKQTALRMKQLSQLKNDLPHTENVCYRLTQTNDFHESEDVSPTCQLCGTKLDEFELNSNASEVPQENNMFGKGDKVDGKIYLRILSKPETKTQQVVDDPLLSVIQQIVSNMSEVPREKLESQQKEVPLCGKTKKVCELCSGCLKPRPITTIIDESREVEDRGVQLQGIFKQEPTIFDDDSLSIQSYEFVKTMDVGCECKVEKNNDEMCFSPPNNRHGESNNDYRNESLDSFVLDILAMLTNDHEIEHLEDINPIYSTEPKSRELRNPTSEVSSNKDKSIDCTCELNYDSKLRSANRIEVTNELSFQSSYIVENLETLNVETDLKKDVATSTYSISIFEQITSLLQMKLVKGQKKRSYSTQCDICPESISKIPSNIIKSREKPIFDSRKVPEIKEQDRDFPEIIEKLCLCGCGYFLEGDSTCSCGCAQYTGSPCIATNHLNQIKHMAKSTINSSIDSKTADENAIKSKKNTHEINSQFCNCKEPSNIKHIPIDPIVKRMNDNIIEIQNSILDPEKKIEINCKHLNDNKQLDLEKEARKLQEKIECYRKENEYFRKLLQQASNGCQRNAEILSCPPPIRATIHLFYSYIGYTLPGLATAIEILQAKCRSKDSMIAILAEGLRGVVNYAQIARNLAAPCLEYSYWDFDLSALYTYLHKTMSKLSLEESKNSTLAPNRTMEDSDDSVPSPKDFKVVQVFNKCLLLSWKIPKNLKNVDGYRIYVNGKLTTNVRSPTRTKTILGFMNSSKPAELKLHSFNKNGTLSDPVTITYSSNDENNQ